MICAVILEKDEKGKTAQMVTKIMPYEDEEKIESSLTHEFRGKRHLSTARFVVNNPESVAFTVSQDGGIPGFAVEDGITTCIQRS